MFRHGRQVGHPVHAIRDATFVSPAVINSIIKDRRCRSERHPDRLDSLQALWSWWLLPSFDRGYTVTRPGRRHVELWSGYPEGRVFEVGTPDLIWSPQCWGGSRHGYRSRHFLIVVGAILTFARCDAGINLDVVGLDPHARRRGRAGPLLTTSGTGAEPLAPSWPNGAATTTPASSMISPDYAAAGSKPGPCSTAGGLREGALADAEHRACIYDLQRAGFVRRGRHAL